MNKIISIISLTIAATVPAMPASAQVYSAPHVLTAPVVVHNGTSAALNTQPIPPGHPLNVIHAIPAGSSLFARSLGINALNTQPIPPGHAKLSTESLNGRKKHHHKSGGTTRHWDLSKGVDS